MALPRLQAATTRCRLRYQYRLSCPNLTVASGWAHNVGQCEGRVWRIEEGWGGQGLSRADW